MENSLWGLWNGISAWPVLIVHVFGAWEGYPVYNVGRDTGGTSSAFCSARGRHSSAVRAREEGED